MNVNRIIGDFLSSVPKLLAVLASLATIVSLIVVVLVLLRDGDSNSERDAGPTIVAPPTPTLDVTRPILPDFAVSEIKSCVVIPVASGGGGTLLSLNFKIINRGNFVFEPNEVFISALSDQGLAVRETEFLNADSWSFDRVLSDWASDTVDLDLPLEAIHLGKLHRITVTVDSTGIGRDGQVDEHDETNNETVVLVLLPEGPLNSDEWITIPCNAPEG